MQSHSVCFVQVLSISYSPLLTTQKYLKYCHAVQHCQHRSTLSTLFNTVEHRSTPFNTVEHRSALFSTVMFTDHLSCCQVGCLFCTVMFSTVLFTDHLSCCQVGCLFCTVMFSTVMLTDHLSCCQVGCLFSRKADSPSLPSSSPRFRTITSELCSAASTSDFFIWL